MADGESTTTWRAVAAGALGLLVLGACWPGRLPGAGVAAPVLLTAAGALIAAELTDRGWRHWLRAAGLALLPAVLALVAVAVAVQIWTPLLLWADALGDVRAAATTAITFDPPPADSPVAALWLVALLAQAAVILTVLRLLLSGLLLHAATIALTAASFAAWTLGSTSVAGSLWPVGLGAVLALAPRPTGRAVPWAVATAAVLAQAVTGAASPRLETLLGALAGGVLVAFALPVRRWRAPVATLTWVAWIVYCGAWPALSLAPQAIGRELGLIDRAVLLAAVAAAAATAVLLGRALRRLPRSSAAAVVALAVAAVLATIPGLDRVEAIEADADQVEAAVTADLPDCFGAATVVARLNGRDCDNPQLDGTTSPPPERIGSDFESFLDCWSRPHDADLNVCDLGGSADAPRVLVLGDSHARVMLGPLSRLADQGAISLTAATKASCGWTTLPLQTPNDPPRGLLCEQWRAKLADWLDEHATDFDVVVTTASSGRMVGPRADRVRGLIEAWQPVADVGVPIVALRDNPRLPSDPDQCLIATDPRDWGDCAVPLDQVGNRYDPFAAAAKQVRGAHALDLMPYFCPDDCPAVIGGVGVHRDDNHVSATYAMTLAPVLYRQIARLGVIDAASREPARTMPEMSH